MSYSCRDELPESYDQVAIKISKAVDGLEFCLLLGNQGLSWGMIHSAVEAVVCVDAENQKSPSHPLQT